jgi:hypothetical protein
VHIRLIYQGAEREPVLVIDDYSAHPDALREEASRAAFAVTAPHYPGLRADLDRAYFKGLIDALVEPICEAFGFRQGVRVDGGWFSMVTTPPERLTLFQRLPHFDGLERNTLAALHYLSSPEHGGTAFYRHRPTGFETMDAARFATYRPMLEREIGARGLPKPAYFNGSDDLFEEIARYDAAFNRLIIYRGCSLHSGVIPVDFDFSADPAQGRLTINTFLHGID